MVKDGIHFSTMTQGSTFNNYLCYNALIEICNNEEVISYSIFQPTI